MRSIVVPPLVVRLLARWLRLSARLLEGGGRRLAQLAARLPDAEPAGGADEPHAPPAHWLARTAGDAPPEHWLTYVNGRALEGRQGSTGPPATAAPAATSAPTAGASPTPAGRVAEGAPAVEPATTITPPADPAAVDRAGGDGIVRSQSTDDRLARGPAAPGRDVHGAAEPRPLRQGLRPGGEEVGDDTSGRFQGATSGAAGAAAASAAAAAAAAAAPPAFERRSSPAPSSTVEDEGDVRHGDRTAALGSNAHPVQPERARRSVPASSGQVSDATDRRRPAATVASDEVRVPAGVADVRTDVERSRIAPRPRAPGAHVRDAAAIGGERAKIVAPRADARVSPASHDAWPSLPENAGVDDDLFGDRWEAHVRRAARRRRLEAEQEGVPWNGSPS